MTNLLFLLSTAFIVSIDSFLAGFSLSRSCKKILPVVLGTASMVYVLCLITNYLGSILQGILTENLVSLGGVILILVGIYNLIVNKKQTVKNSSVILQSLITGFGVGLDGACANLSLAIMGINGFYVPIIIAVMHLIMIYSGAILSNTAFNKILQKYQFIPPILLMLLGLYKLYPVIFSLF